MKNQFNAVTMAVGTLIFVCGIAAGYFMKECPQKPPDQIENLAGSFTSLKDAHAYSVNYRTLSGYCDGDPECNFNREGYFQMTENDIDSLKKAVEEIKAAVGRAGEPVYFNFIFGRDTTWSEDITESLLLVAGVHPASGREYTQNIKLIPTRLPCPRYCDVMRSEIISSGGNVCK